jgi:hypothetical protein
MRRYKIQRHTSRVLTYHKRNTKQIGQGTSDVEFQGLGSLLHFIPNFSTSAHNAKDKVIKRVSRFPKNVSDGVIRVSERLLKRRKVEAREVEARDMGESSNATAVEYTMEANIPECVRYGYVQTHKGQSPLNPMKIMSFNVTCFVTLEMSDDTFTSECKKIRLLSQRNNSHRKQKKYHLGCEDRVI